MTELVGLEEKVTYRVGDATRLELADESVDRIVSQESFLHIEDRVALFSGCYRVLAQGGGLGFTDVMATELTDDVVRARFADEFAAPQLATLGDYESLMAGAGFVGIAIDPLPKLNIPGISSLPVIGPLLTTTRQSRVLLFGFGVLMLGDGLQSTLLGVLAGLPIPHAGIVERGARRLADHREPGVGHGRDQGR